MAYFDIAPQHLHTLSPNLSGSEGKMRLRSAIQQQCQEHCPTMALKVHKTLQLLDEDQELIRGLQWAPNCRSYE